ncbi:MAG TPA: hypothetical protein VEI03_14430 [Stellaceae bacterium]|nr:hypothetical protein [Stellaceae bacterium]
MSYWIFGVVAALFGLLGAVLAAKALDLGMLTFGLGLLAFAVVFVFWMIKDYFDQRERAAG